ncbi:MAG TPA: ParB/RepB/Spo0J family partition protein [Candidatus Limnocylindria bacterium]|nr:ParB/RepB/Spo0J family partition protein [Candidatus Limnocylindria bacterium]
MTLSSASLLPFAEVRQRLGLVDQSYIGVRPIPVDRILGSLDRTVDFDRDFRPRSSHLESRLRSLRQAYPAGDFPPITVYEVGGAYFVVDGHHRVALSRELGQTFIDADVVRLATQYDLDPSVDVLTLVHTQQHQRFMEESGLDVARPEARFEFLRPDAYVALLAVVHAFAYRRSLAAGRLLDPSDTAAAWYDSEYLPALTAIHEAGLHRRYAYNTDADLFLWVEGRRRSLEPLHSAASWRDAAQAAAGEWHGPLTRRRLTSQKRTPLRPRQRPTSA